MGAGGLDYKQQSQRIARYTGGLSLSHHISSSPSDLDMVLQAIHLQSFCLKENITPMFELWADIFNKYDIQYHLSLCTIDFKTKFGD